MNETTRKGLDLDVVDLGDAKEVTMGVPGPTNPEEHPQIPWYDLSE